MEPTHPRDGQPLNDNHANNVNFSWRMGAVGAHRAYLWGNSDTHKAEIYQRGVKGSPGATHVTSVTRYNEDAPGTEMLVGADGRPGIEYSTLGRAQIAVAAAAKREKPYVSKRKRTAKD